MKRDSADSDSGHSLIGEKNPMQAAEQISLALRLNQETNFWYETAKGIPEAIQHALNDDLHTGRLCTSLIEGAGFGIGLSLMLKQKGILGLAGQGLGALMGGQFALHGIETIGKVKDLHDQALKSPHLFQNNVLSARKLIGGFSSEAAVGAFGTSIGVVGAHRFKPFKLELAPAMTPALEGAGARVHSNRQNTIHETHHAMVADEGSHFANQPKQIENQNATPVKFTRHDRSYPLEAEIGNNTTAHFDWDDGSLLITYKKDGQFNGQVLSQETTLYGDSGPVSWDVTRPNQQTHNWEGELFIDSDTGMFEWRPSRYETRQSPFHLKADEAQIPHSELLGLDNCAYSNIERWYTKLPEKNGKQFTIDPNGDPVRASIGANTEVRFYPNARWNELEIEWRKDEQHVADLQCIGVNADIPRWDVTHADGTRHTWKGYLDLNPEQGVLEWHPSNDMSRDAQPLDRPH